MESDEFCLKWNNHHSVLINVLDKLLEKESMCDVTLAAEHQFVRVHRLVLCACSEYFEEMLSKQPDKQAFIFLKDVSFPNLKALVDYMYKGEVNVAQVNLTSFLQTAEALDIKGLVTRNEAESQQLPSRTGPSTISRSSGLKRTNESNISPPFSIIRSSIATSPSSSVNRNEPSKTDQLKPPPTKRALTAPSESSTLPFSGDLDLHFEVVQPKTEFDEITIADDQPQDWSSLEAVDVLPHSDLHSITLPTNAESAEPNGNNHQTAPNCVTVPAKKKSSSTPSSRGKQAIENKNRDRFDCPNCIRNYKSRRLLIRHLRAGCDDTTDINNLRTSRLPVFKCSSCSYATYIKSNLMRHAKNHHGGSG